MLGVGMLGVGAFAVGTATFVVAGVLGDLAADLGTTPGAAGSVAAVFAVASAIGSPLLSTTLRVRPRLLLIGSLLLFGAFTALAAAAPDLPGLLVARVLSALAAAAYVPAAGAAAVAAVPPSHRARALSVVLGGASAAMVLGAPLGAMLAAAYSWRAAFVLVAAMAGLAAAGVWLAGTDPGRDVAAIGSTGERLRPLRTPAVGGALGVTVLVMTGSMAVFTYLDTVPAPVGIGALIAVFGIGGVAGTAVGGAVVDRWGARPVALLAVGVLVVAFALSPVLATTTPGACVFVALWGVAGFGFVPAQQHRLLALGAGPAPVLLALISSATHVGFAAGAALGGRVVDAGGPLWVVGVACCGAAAVLHAVLTSGRRS